jgi:hypothetical protein
MKKYLILLLTTMLFIANVATAQFRKVPATVTEAFKVKFPYAKNVSWSDKITSFQASFDQDDTKWAASFGSKGDWKKTEKDLVLNDLPGVVNDELKDTKYAGWTTKAVTRIEENDGKFEYRIFIEKSSINKKYVYLSKEGQVLRESQTL